MHLFLLAAIVIGTWNGNWFPSGRAEHRAHPDVEAATTTAAARMLRDGLDRLDPLGTNDVILCLNEIRGPRAASNLVAQIGRAGLRVAAISGYRRRDRFDQQQDVIATTLPVGATRWRIWDRHGNETPPRGYVAADLVLSAAVTATVCAVHLKSNYGATTRKIADLNRAKRSHSIAELVVREANSPSRPIVLCGDFNADPWRKEFAAETIFTQLKAAGFANLLALLPPNARGTHPNRKYGDSALDSIQVRGLNAVGLPVIMPNEGLSDHFALYAMVLIDGAGGLL